MNDPAPPPPARWYRSPIWALVTLVFCMPLLFSALKRVRMVNEVEKWLPLNDPGAEILAWSQSHFEPENRFLVSWDSSSLADPRVQALAERLQPAGRDQDHPLHDVQEVITPGRVLSGMMSQGVDQNTAIERLQGILVGTGMPKVRLSDAGRAKRPEVEANLIEFTRGLGMSLEIVPPVTPQAPKPEPAAAAAAPVEPAEGNAVEEFDPALWRAPAHDFQVRAPGLSYGSPEAEQLLAHARNLPGELVEDCFFAPGAPVALTVSVAEEGDIRLRDTLIALRAAAQEVGIPADELRLGGSPIGRVELNMASFRSIWNTDYPWWMVHKRSPMALSALVGTVLAFILLKSFRLALLVLFIATYAAAMTVALVPATGQSLNTVLIVMPNLMLVVTMSSLIHLANYWRHAAFAGKPDPVGQAVRMSIEPTLMAGVTTAIGLASLVTSVLLPVRQFGLYSAAGCLLALVMVLWAFPSLMRLWPGRPAPVAPPHENDWYRFGLWVAQHRRWVAATCLGLYGISIWGLQHFQTETKVIRYFPDDARIVRDYEFLEDNLAGIVGVDVLLRFPPERRRADDEDEEGNPVRPEIAAAPPVVQLDLFQRMQLVRKVQQRLEQTEGITGAMSLADFRIEVESRPEKVDSRYLRSLQVAKKRIFDTRREDTREFVTRAQTPLSVVVDGVPVRIEAGEEVWRIRAQCSVLTSRHYADFLDEIDATLDSELRGYAGVEHLVTGMVPLFLRTQEALLESLIKSFGVAFATIAAVMMYQIRSVLAGALVMLPNILPIVLVFGLISWYGIPLDVGTMITASIAMGISVDSELHFVSWFRHSLEQGMNRQEAVAHALVHCGPAMWQSCLVIASALQMLAFTDLLMISRFGWLMAAMIMTALLADLFYMPALLAGVMGRLIERQQRGSAPAPGRESEAAREVVRS